MRSAICWWVRTACAAFEMTDSGIEMRSVTSSAGARNPGSTRRMAWKVRIIRPDETSRTTASAICATTRVLRARWRSRPALDEPAAFLQRAGDVRRAESQHRNQPEQQARDHRQPEREQQDQRPDRDRVQARQPGRRRPLERLDAGVGEQRARARRRPVRGSDSRPGSPPRAGASRRRARRGSRAPAGGPRPGPGTGWRRWRTRSAGRWRPCRASPTTPAARRR